MPTSYSHNPTELLALAVATAKKAAGRLLVSDKKVVGHLERDVKIEADFKLHQIIKEELSSHSPYPILSEEDAYSDKSNKQDLQWIVDPLDGSLNFSRGIPLYCISIALWKNHEPYLGVVYDFLRNELFEGIVGNGAKLNKESIKVSSSPKKEAILCTGFPTGMDFSNTSLEHFISQIQSYKKIRLLGSAALSLSYVACGRAEAYHEESIAIWDVAAGLALVKAAGGAIDYQSASKPNRLIVKAGIV